MNARGDKEEERLLELLNAVEQRSDVSQRHLARHMGVALGLANSYLRRCIRKGFIKITEAPANRYLYYLTPKGFAEKSRLTVNYLSISFEFYRQSGQSCAAIFRKCEAQGWRRVVLCGVSDLAEIALLRALEAEVTVVGMIDGTAKGSTFLGRPLWQKLEDADSFDCCVLTDLRSPRDTYARLTAGMDPERILIPDILRL